MGLSRSGEGAEVSRWGEPAVEVDVESAAIDRPDVLNAEISRQAIQERLKLVWASVPQDAMQTLWALAWEVSDDLSIAKPVLRPGLASGREPRRRLPWRCRSERMTGNGMARCFFERRSWPPNAVDLTSRCAARLETWAGVNVAGLV